MHIHVIPKFYLGELVSQIGKIKKEPILCVCLLHFLILGGYKLFSIYFPIYLAEKGFSLVSIGSIYVFVYLSNALSGFFINYEERKFDAVKLLILSFAGYGICALGYLFAQSLLHFFALQILLGFASALFYISAKTIIILSGPKKSDFLYFYSIPFYATLAAPLIGGLLIWKFGFGFVFVTAQVLFLAGMLFALLKLRVPCRLQTIDEYNPKIYFKKLGGAFKTIERDRVVLLFLSIAFLDIVSVGIFRTYFILFLRNLGLNQLNITFYVALISLSTILISLKLGNYVRNRRSTATIRRGVLVSGIGTMLLPVYSLMGWIFSMNVLDYTGKLISNAGQSALISKKLSVYKPEAATLDTVLTSVGVATGSLLGGVLINLLGFKFMFILLGSLMLAVGLLSRRIR